MYVTVIHISCLYSVRVCVVYCIQTSSSCALTFVWITSSAFVTRWTLSFKALISSMAPV